MELEELEFKPEDFFQGGNISGEAPLLAGFFNALGKECAEKANRILREKLAKAPEVFGYLDSDFGMMVYMEDAEGPYEVTHRARLVAIEEIK